MKEPIVTGEFDERDVRAAIEPLKSAPFKTRYIRTDCNAKDPVWNTPDGQPIHEHIRDLMDKLKADVGALRLHDLHGGVFHKYDSGTLVTVGTHHLGSAVVAPTARDLLHVYGPDRDNTQDSTRYYRYAWTDKGPNAIIYSTDQQIIREGKLGCNSYAYSGQSSYALVGAGMFFLPKFGNAKVSIRPYVQWLTRSSFTGTDTSVPASATASLGIFVESWERTGGLYNVDHDHWIPVWSQPNSQSYLSDVTAGGAASVGDGLAAEILAVTSRKYAIYVYAYLETSAGPQQHQNELRFVTIDIDAVVPYVVVEEKLA